MEYHGTYDIVSLQSRILLLAIHSVKLVETGSEAVGNSPDFCGFMASDSNDTANALCDPRFLRNDEVFDVSGLFDVPAIHESALNLDIEDKIILRSTAELYTRTPPLRVLDIAYNFIDLILKRNNPYGIGVCFAKDGAESRDLLGSLEVDLLAKDADIAADPILADGLDLCKLALVDL